ncbi:MAG TPA: phosphate ABC transporter substrate-binding protein PstS family protein [Candidatus Aphodovivens avistercoris]|nr:phosphate ABC transporter substrate-binding protein PstS family protein [Candidatus Aphodovivens avistercoris]
MSRRRFLTVAGGTAALAGLGMVGCSSNGGSSEGEAEGGSEGEPAAELSGSITAVGSTALQPLVEAAAEQFMEENSGVQITIQGGGSGQGITQIVQGAVQIGNSDVFAEEKVDDPADAEKIKDNRVCVVGMGPIVNPEVSVDDIAIADLAKIFTGEITNWNQVGGSDQEIVVINRQAGSGTRAVFEAAVLGDQESATFQEQDSSGTVAKMVSETPGAISYLAFSYFDDSTKALSVDGVAPETANVEDNSWTIWAYEHMYTALESDAATQAFIDYMMSEEVQGSLVEENGYIPVSGMKVEKDAEGNVTQL